VTGELEVIKRPEVTRGVAASERTEVPKEVKVTRLREVPKPAEVIKPLVARIAA
jgi:hypothetical protein